MLHSNRKFAYLRLILIFAAVILVSTTFHLKADSSSPSTVSLTLPDGSVADLEFSADPAPGDCGTPTLSAGQSVWQCSDYSLSTEASQVQGGYSVAFQLRRADGGSFTSNGYRARVSLPYSQGDAISAYSLDAAKGLMYTDLATPLTYLTSPNQGIPFVMVVDSRGVSRLSIGLMSQEHIVVVEGALSEDSAEYTVSMKQIDTLQTSRLRDAFFISQNQDTWFNQAKAYTSAVDARRGYVPLSIPPSALNPTYDSWYWTQDQIDQAMVWNLAQISCSLGFKSYLFDSGWDTRAGEYAKWLEGSTGNYIPPRGAFPDFPGLLSDIRNQLGMKVMLWMQHYALGRKSIYYPTMVTALSWMPDANGELQETPALCPRVAETGQHMARLFDRIMSDYQPDALWFDWQEGIAAMCAAPHNHDYGSLGEGYNSAQQMIANTVMQHNPNAFMEMRWPSANLNNKPYVQLWQPVDSPEDYEAMRLRAMNMRPYSSGVLMGTDEMYWDPSLADVDQARFMSTVVFTGVPYFGPNLIAVSPYQNNMLKTWLAFYDAHQTDLVAGDFRPYGDRDHPDHIIEGSQETFIYYGNGYNRVDLSKPNDHIYIVNASKSEDLNLVLTGLSPGSYSLAVSDLFLKNVRLTELSAATDRVRLRMSLPVGCLLTLIWRSDKPINPMKPSARGNIGERN